MPSADFKSTTHYVINYQIKTIVTMRACGGLNLIIQIEKKNLPLTRISRPY